MSTARVHDEWFTLAKGLALAHYDLLLTDEEYRVSVASIEARVRLSELLSELLDEVLLERANNGAQTQEAKGERP